MTASLRRFVRDTMLEVAGRYDSYSYWTRRNLIGAEMQMRLDQVSHAPRGKAGFLAPKQCLSSLEAS